MSVAEITEAADSCRVLTLDEFWKAVLRAGRNHGPALLAKAWFKRVIEPETVTAAVAGIWTLAEWPEHTITRSLWLDLFQAAGFTVDGKPAARPGEAIRLYRGCTKGGVRGMSWTTDRDVAEWFATRFTHLGPAAVHVYETLCPPSAMLCIPGTEGRENEHEIVINPAVLKIGRMA